MNEQRLDSIEKRFKYSVIIDGQGKELAIELIQALREERAKSAVLQKEIDKITILRPIKNIQNNIKTIKKI